eukprot:15482863-Alexandrium_andersonii.AAC.1
MARALSSLFGTRASISSACSASHSAVPSMAVSSNLGPKMVFPRQIMSQPSLASSGKAPRMRLATSSMPTPLHFPV